jgi:hypothetical protein
VAGWLAGAGDSAGARHVRASDTRLMRPVASRAGHRNARVGRDGMRCARLSLRAFLFAVREASRA